jgi:hypothetical protein
MSLKMRGQKIFDILTAHSCAPVVLPDSEVWEWQQRWRALYARELHAETGKWTLNDFDWHVFSFDKHKHKQGDHAWSEFRRVPPCSFLVLSAYIHDTFGFTCDGKPPDRLEAGKDIIVAPPSLEWTMAFNHERYGPYFAVP